MTDLKKKYHNLVELHETTVAMMVTYPEKRNYLRGELEKVNRWLDEVIDAMVETQADQRNAG